MTRRTRATDRVTIYCVTRKKWPESGNNIEKDKCTGDE